MIKLSPDDISALMEMFLDLGDVAITYNHHDLANVTAERNPEIWKAFLLDPTVITWKQTELNLMAESEISKMIKGASKSRSVGQAQMVNAIAKTRENTTVKEGPIFIYTYVPLTKQEEQAPNVNKETHDIFTEGVF